MVTKTVKLQTSSRVQWRNALTLVAMIKLNLKLSRLNRACVLITGLRRWRHNWKKVFRWSFFYSQAKKESALSMTTWKSSCWLSFLCHHRWFLSVQLRKAKIYAQLWVKYSFRWMRRWVVSHGLWIACHLCRSQQWFVVWMFSTVPLLERNQFSLLLPQWTSLQQLTGQRV